MNNFEKVSERLAENVLNLTQLTLVRFPNRVDTFLTIKIIINLLLKLEQIVHY